MLLKLDLSKAFDKLNWNYMEKVLLAFGFNQSWVSWIKNLISSSFLSILMNGSPTAPFIPSQDIRQGYPLSPFLFILAVECLGRSIKVATNERKLHGLCLHQMDDTHTHQQFLDDTMLFGKSIVSEAKALKKILQNFSLASGASINENKSNVFFFNTPTITQRNILKTMNFHLPSKYLGAPLIDRACQFTAWEDLILRLKKCLSSWSFRCLNLAVKVILVKSVLQSMPLYLLSALTTPKFILKALRNLQRNFL